MEFDDIEEDLYWDSYDILDEILGEKVSRNKKNELLELILTIFRKNTKEYNNNMNMLLYNNNYLQNSNQNCTRSSNPSINIFICSQLNSLYPQNTGYNQQLPIQLIQNPYFTNNSQIQSYQDPYYYNSQIIPNKYSSNQHKKTKSDSHKKKESKEKNKKSKNHDKKSNSKKKSKKDHEKSNNNDNSTEIFEYQLGHEFEGIINYLTNKTGGNIHDNGTIIVTTNSISNSRHPKNVLTASLESEKMFLNPSEITIYRAKEDDKFFWICFDFKDMEIEISDYTIKSAKWKPNSGHIKSWVIEVSNDQNDWIQIDSHNDCRDLNGPNFSHVFHANVNKFARYCRFRHTGDYWGHSFNGPCIDQMEFFGKLKTSKK